MRPIDSLYVIILCSLGFFFDSVAKCGRGIFNRVAPFSHNDEDPYAGGAALNEFARNDFAPKYASLMLGYDDENVLRSNSSADHSNIVE